MLNLVLSGLNTFNTAINFVGENPGIHKKNNKPNPDLIINKKNTKSFNNAYRTPCMPQEGTSTFLIFGLEFWFLFNR